MNTTAPLTPAVVAILLSLASGDRHGYAIMKDVRTPEGGRLAMGPGTLYGTLERLMRDGLVIESDFSDDQRRRYYKISRVGLFALEAEIARLEFTLATARSRGLLSKAGQS